MLTGSGLYPIVGFGVSVIEPSCSLLENEFKMLTCNKVHDESIICLRPSAGGQGLDSCASLQHHLLPDMRINVVGQLMMKQDVYSNLLPIRWNVMVTHSLARSLSDFHIPAG